MARIGRERGEAESQSVRNRTYGYYIYSSYAKLGSIPRGVRQQAIEYRFLPRGTPFEFQARRACYGEYIKVRGGARKPGCESLERVALWEMVIPLTNGRGQ